MSETHQDRPPLDRVKRCVRENGPRCLPYEKDLCPATPFRAPGSGLRLPRGLATAMQVVDAFAIGSTPFRACPTLAPVHTFRCHRVRASLSFGDACRLLQPE